MDDYSLLQICPRRVDDGQFVDKLAPPFWQCRIL